MRGSRGVAGAHRGRVKRSPLSHRTGHAGPISSQRVAWRKLPGALTAGAQCKALRGPKANRGSWQVVGKARTSLTSILSPNLGSQVWKAVRVKLHEDLGDLRARVAEYVAQQEAQ